MKTSFRRVLALMLCVFVLMAGTPFFSAYAKKEQAPDAAEKQETLASETDAAEPEAPACAGTGEHVFETYTPAEGNQHSAVCTLCGAEFLLPCEAAPDAEYTPDGKGSHTAVCSLCGGTVTEACVYEEAVTAPTQKEAGFTTCTCTVCGATVTDAETPAEGGREESFLIGDLNRDGAVGADDARSLLRISVLLDRVESEMLPYADFDGSGDVTSADARLALRCSVGLEPLPERHEYTVTVTEAAACTEAGALTFSCSYCGKSGDMKVLPLGHSYETVSEQQPTCTADGKRADRCTVCKEERTVILRAKGHSFEQKALTEPTCTAAGEETLVCTVCQAEQKNTLPALGHDWAEATPEKAKHCTRCGEIVSGWTEIDGKSYFFKEDGSPMKGKQFMDGLVFSFGKDGASQTGRTGRKPKVAVLGDSIVATIADSNVATDFDMYGKVSLHVDNIDSRSISGHSRTVLREAEGRDYDIVILMIGVNDLTYDDTAWGRMYRGVLQKLKDIVPDALIYAHAILPINDSKTGSGEKMWRVNAKNKVIKNAAEAEGVGYLGIPPEMLDSNGQLPYGAASDGVHFGITYCRIWYNWVKAQLK